MGFFPANIWGPGTIGYYSLVSFRVSICADLSSVSFPSGHEQLPPQPQQLSGKTAVGLSEKFIKPTNR